jgi:GT2 family glycosyltransferase/glycosyltransferase involved in cell wall biosynthesis
MDTSRRKLNKVRQELNAFIPDQYGDPLEPQPSILPPPILPSDTFLVKSARKIDRVINGHPKLKNTVLYARPINARRRKANNPANRVREISFSAPATVVEVSIVIPVFNKFDLTMECLRSIRDKVGSKITYEVIVVDNNSDDETPNLLGLLNLKYIKSKVNLGFVKGCNLGAASAKGDYIVFLNNDAVVTDGWLEALIDTYKIHKNIGLVGSKIIYPDGRLQEAGGIIFKDGTGENYGKNDHPGKFQYNYVREVDYCSGASIIIKRSLFDELKGFDELYQPAYYEDTDLAFRVRQKNLKVLYQPNSVIYHIEGATAGTDVSGGFKKYQEINHKKFLQKWGKELKTSQYEQQDKYKARDRSNNKLFLIVDEHVPTPDKDAGSVRMIAMIKLLQELGYKVTFFPNFTKHQGKYTEYLQQIGVEVIYGRVWFEEFIKLYGGYYDAILLSRPRIGSYYMDLCQAYCNDAQIIYDTVDLHYLRLNRQAEYESGNLKDYYKEMSEKHRLLEQDLIKEADKALVVSEVELNLLNKMGYNNISLLSTIHSINTSAYEVGFAKRKDIVFVGGFKHLPNVDAVNWLVDEIMPLISEVDSSIKLHIAGADMPEDLANSLKMHRGVVVEGFVPDLSDLLTNCRVFIAPMRYGAGVKGKITQAIEYGLPVVTTGIGAEGMYLQDLVSCMTANEPKGLAKALLKIYDDEALWLRIQTGAKQVLNEHFSKNSARENLNRILAK